MVYHNGHSAFHDSDRCARKVRARRSYALRRTEVVADALRELAAGATLEIERVPRVLVGVCFLLKGPIFLNGLVVAVNYHPDVKVFSNSSDGAILRGHVVSAVGRAQLGNKVDYVPCSVSLADMRVQHIFDLKRAVKTRQDAGQIFDPDRVLSMLEQRYSLRSRG